MKTLVTGAAGFVGSHLCEDLVRCGDTVVGLDCFLDNYDRSLKEDHLRRLAGETSFELIHAASLDVDLERLLDGVDRVFHLAALPGVRPSWGRAFADYLCAPETEIAPKPRTLGFDLAAAVPLAGLTALQGLRDCGQLRPDDRVLIIGASGGVGTFAVQLAKDFGGHVTGVCSTKNLEMVRSLGADEVIDYTQQDFAEAGEKYDVIFQLGGKHSPSHCRRALTPGGRLVLSSGDSDGTWIGPMDRIIKAAALSPFVSQTLAALNIKPSRADLEKLAGLIDDGKLKPVIDRTYALEEVAEAVRYVEQGHARGKVLVRIDEDR